VSRCQPRPPDPQAPAAVNLAMPTSRILRDEATGDDRRQAEGRRHRPSEPVEPHRTNVVDLMAAVKKSLGEPTAKEAASPASESKRAAAAPTAFRKRPGWSMVARNANAVSGPTPGTVISRRHAGSMRTSSSARLVNRPSSRVVTSMTDSNDSRLISTGSSAAGSRTRAGKVFAAWRANLRPNFAQQRPYTEARTAAASIRDRTHSRAVTLANPTKTIWPSADRTPKTRQRILAFPAFCPCGPVGRLGSVPGLRTTACPNISRSHPAVRGTS
jgi:hypothetical protein